MLFKSLVAIHDGGFSNIVQFRQWHVRSSHKSIKQIVLNLLISLNNWKPSQVLGKVIVSAGRKQFSEEKRVTRSSCCLVGQG